ncbi:MAG: serine/threonine-protein kinase [Thermoanaerobaculia bacterium]|nr:serine/threonine-protein kinase [Thermoanaerobaculia bacterium]
MTLESGRKIGPYEIVSLAGAGGMGEVYRARDTRLDRAVAIKVLPAGLGANAEFRERFEREARAISAFSHPHICALYDVGNIDGIEYLVMEYLEGETLAERLARGPLPTSQIVRFGAQIAEALQKAHRTGIMHRDLKPGNIMITASGAKLLDFGLAKLTQPEVLIDDVTQRKPLTREGAIVGTFRYMSPEQLEGKSLDHRTDIFSLGVVLYEMATGQHPFQGDSQASLIAAILSNDPPPIRTIQPSIPPALERIIHTALEKNPDERWQTAQDIARQLRWISETSLSAEQAAPVKQRRIPVAAIVLITALAAGLLGWATTRLGRGSTPTPLTARLHVALPPESQLRAHPELSSFALSPDGRTIVFAAGTWTGGRGPSSLFLRALDSYEIRKLEGTDGAVSPFWSSDGKWVGFSARSKLWKVRTEGGTPPEAICDVVSAGARASWQGDTILFGDSRGDRTELYTVPDAGGTPVKVTSLRKGEWRHQWPTLLPDEEHFIYLAFSALSLERRLTLASLDSPAQTVLVSNVSNARMLGKDRLAYVRDGKLLSQRFDAAKGRFTGEPETVAADVSYFYPTARAEFDASAAGVVVYRTATSTSSLVTMDREGTVTKVLEDKDLVYDQMISPDGKTAAVTIVTRGTGLMDIWSYDLVRGVRDRLTSDPGIEVSPSWSPDGRSIVFSQGEGGAFPHLALRRLGGSETEDLTPRDAFQFSPVFSPDGELIYFARDIGFGSDIYRLHLKTKKAEAVISSSHSESQPQPSPDGKWLAFTSTATGPYEVYIQSLLDSSARIRISDNDGRMARWRRDGKELFYISASNSVMSVVPGADGRWDAAKPRELFRIPQPVREFDVFPDGRSFLISTTTQGAADPLIHVVIGPE